MAAALLALGFLVPLHELPWPGFIGDVCAAVALLLLVFKSPSRRWPLPALAVLALAAVPLLQHAFGLVIYRGDAVMASLYLVGLAFAIQIGAQPAFLHGGEASRFARAVFCAALASALVALACALGWMPEGPWLGPQLHLGRAVANLAQPNLLATLLVLGLVALLAGWPSDRRQVMLAGGAAVLLLVTLALSVSRTGLLEALLVLGMALMSPQRLGLRLSRSGLLALLAVLLLAVGMTWLFPQGAARGWAHGESTTARWDYVRVFAAALQNSPWAGYGFNQVSVAQSRQMLLGFAPPAWTEHSHNTALDVLLWCGLPLGMLVIAGLAAVLWTGLRALRHDARLGPVALGLGVLLVHAELEYPLDYFIFLLPFGLLLGRFCAHGGSVELPAAVGRAFAALGAATFVAVVIDYRRITPHLTLARQALARPTVLATEPSPAVLLDQLTAQLEMALYVGRSEPARIPLAALEAATERFPYADVMARVAADAQAQGDTLMSTRMNRRLQMMSTLN